MKAEQEVDVQLIIYEPVEADAKAFIDFWAARYTAIRATTTTSTARMSDRS
jgi:hypothetical protein